MHILKNSFLIQAPKSFKNKYFELEKQILKLIWKFKDPRIANTLLKKKKYRLRNMSHMYKNVL